MSHIHQSSSHFKQSNKAHKSRHLTKGLLKQKTKGKVADDQRLSLKESTKLASKIDRKSGAKSKRQQAQQAKRQANQEPPKIVGILSLSSTISSAKVFDAIINTTEKAGESRSPNDVTVFLNQTKQRVNLLIPPKPDDLVAILDILKVADVLVLVIETNQGVDAHGEKLISLIKAQGQPAILGALSGLESVPPKHRNQTKKDITKLFHMRFPDEPRLVPFELDTANNSPVPQDFAQVLRFIGAIPAQSHRWRERRPYIVADQLEFLPGGEGLVGTVLLSGYIRGAALDVNNLIHIPDWGDFQVKQIDAATDPYVRRRGKDSMETESNMDENGATRQTLAVADPKLQETLETENAPDDMANEQTWPTDEELKEAEDSFRKKVAGDPKKKKKVPRGTSSYQAAWIVESEGEEDEDGDEDDEMADESRGDTQKDEHDQGEEGKLGTEEEEWEELKEDEKEKSKAEKEDEDDAMEEDEATKEEEEQDELTFPDEVQTPYDVAARVRFQKYRGLKSFRSSPWDPKEMLPREYARIFQFQNFFKTKKRVLQHDKLSVEIGQYVTLHVLNVPKSCIDSIDPSKPIVAGGLLKYENKTSVLHFSLTKHASYIEPVKSKDPLVFVCGFRRYKVNPIYSQNNPGINKHKYERFLHPGRTSVATIYGPITFPQLPLVVLNEATNELVATGSLISVDPDRVVLKKIILTGRPFKIHKKTVVVRQMFHNQHDVAWFKPVELWTKYGRAGSIRESIGTHGNMKCIFDGTVGHHDVVCMNLYKRIYPVWKDHQDALPPIAAING